MNTLNIRIYIPFTQNPYNKMRSDMFSESHIYVRLQNVVLTQVIEFTVEYKLNEVDFVPFNIIMNATGFKLVSHICIKINNGRFL